MNPNDLQSVWLHEHETELAERLHCEECSAEPDVECDMAGAWLCTDCLDPAECRECTIKSCPIHYEARFVKFLNS
jgi:hypothetical protein